MANACIMLSHPATSLGCAPRVNGQILRMTNFERLGFSTAFGIFQEYYSTHNVLQGDKGDLATVGTTSTV